MNVCRRSHGNLSNRCWDVFIHINIYVTLAPRRWTRNCHPQERRIRSTMPRIKTKEVQEFLSWSQVPNTKTFLTWGVTGVDIGVDARSRAPLILLQNAAIMIPERKTGRGVVSYMSWEVVTGCCTHVICYLFCLCMRVGNMLLHWNFILHNNKGLLFYFILFYSKPNANKASSKWAGERNRHESLRIM